MNIKTNPHRKSLRLRGYDYSQSGAYFITVCSHQRLPLYGNVQDGCMELNIAGVMVEQCWREIPQHFRNIELGEYVVMPNHFHGIIHIVGAQFIAPVIASSQDMVHQVILEKGVMNHAPTVGDVVRAFKARCTHGINKMNAISGAHIWQRNYYEHIIRNERTYQHIAEYIHNNPLQWQEDTYYMPNES